MPGAPAHPVTPGLAALGCRDARGGHAGGGRDPPGKGEASGGRGDTQHAGGTGGTRPCVAAVGDTGVRGDQPCAGWGARAGGSAPTWPPRPLARPPGLCPLPAAAPGSSALTCGPHSAALPACVTRPWQGLWGLLFSPCGGLGERMEPRRAGWGPGTLAGSGAGGQHGVQGPPLAQPLMSPVRGAG